MIYSSTLSENIEIRFQLLREIQLNFCLVLLADILFTTLIKITKAVIKKKKPEKRYCSLNRT